MDGEGDQRDQHEERLREVFQSFDGSGAGSLSPEELTELCHTLQLADQALHTLFHTLFDTQDLLNTRVEFEQFRDALIVVLSSNEETLAKENPPRPVSPEVQPRFVKGTKRYGRRSTPEFTQSISDQAHTPSEEREEDAATRTSDDTLPVKRERWNADVSSPEEYEAEGQLHLWNPDEPSTPRGSVAPLSDLEERLYNACQQLSLPLHGTATVQQLRTLCQHLDLEVAEDILQSADEKNVSVQEFVSYIQTNSKPPTPSASTPYRQLKRHHSTQPFDEMGRRISSVMSSTIGLRLFSELDDGTGHTAVELLLDAWLEDGVENSSEILQALDFSLDGKVNLSELTAALENELMVTKNSIHQAALASFKAEIRYLLEQVDLELRAKKKLHSDLEKAEKLKSQLASEVDEHHSTIERINNLNLRKLEQEHKERVMALRTELSKEVELVHQQANQQREELEQEISRIREDESFLREHLTLTIKENERLQVELLDGAERLMEVESQLNKLQKNLDNVLKEKFGDLDLSSAEVYQQEERLRQLRNSYEEQCRELQDRIDELQAQLEEFHALSCAPQTSLMPSLSDELDSTSPGMESDQGLGSEEGQPFNMSLEAEMMLEHLKEQHIKELKNMRAQLDSTVNKCEHRLEEQKTSLEEERSRLSLQHQQEIKVVREELNETLEHAQDLQEQLEQERRSMEAQQNVERSELHAAHQQQVASLSQELQDARGYVLKLEEQLRVLEERERAEEESRVRDIEELRRAHEEELSQMELHYKETLKSNLQNQKGEAERTLLEELQKEKQCLEKVYEEVLKVRLEELQQFSEQERIELERRLREEWEWEKQLLEESRRKTLQEEVEHLQQEQEESCKRLQEQWGKKHTLLQEQHHTELQKCLQQERERLLTQQEGKEHSMMEEWKREQAQLREQHEEVLKARLQEQRAQLLTQEEEQDKRWQKVLEEQQGQMEEAHRKAMQELSMKHGEEREILSCMLESLRTDFAKERKKQEKQFAQTIKEVEDHFFGHQGVVLKHFQTFFFNKEKHYQSKVAALTQCHAANCMQQEAELETTSNEAQQLRKLQPEAHQLEKETIIAGLAQAQIKLEHSHTVANALMERNLYLQSELENIVTSIQNEDIEFRHEMYELCDRLQEYLKENNTWLVRKESIDTKHELLLRYVLDNLAQDKTKFSHVTSFEESTEHGIAHEYVDSSVGARSFTEDTKVEVVGKLCEISAEVSNKMVAFGIMNTVPFGLTKSSASEICNHTYSEMADMNPVNNTKHEEGKQHIELNSGTFFKDTDDMAEREVPTWSRDELNPVGLLVKNGTVCINSDIFPHSSNRTRGFKNANNTTSMTDPDLFIVKVTQYDLSYHEEQKQGLEKQEKIEDDYTIFKSDVKSMTSSQPQFLALACGRMLDLCAIEILELQTIAVQFKCQSSLLELLQEQYRSTLKENLFLQEQLFNLQQRNDELELLLDLNRSKLLTSQKVNEESHNLRIDMVAMAGHAKELEIKALELAEYVCRKVQVAEQKMKLERRVHLESKMHIVQEFQEQQSRLLKHIMSMHKENERLSEAVHDLEYQKVLLTMQKEDDSTPEESSDDSIQDLSFQLGMKFTTLRELEYCSMDFDKQNPCLQSAVTYLQKKSHRINKKIQEYRIEAGRLAEENLLLRKNISELREEDLKEKQQELLLKVEHFRKEKYAAQKMADGLKRQISELRRRGKQLEEENNALSQQNAKHALSVDTLQHTLEEVILHHGNGSSNERSEIEEGDFKASVSRTEKLEDEKKLLRAELNRCVEKMAQLRSAETQLAQLLHERQISDKHSQALRTQMIKAQERVQALDFTLQGLTQQNARLKSDLRITQQEREALKQEVISLHKQLQNANEKCHLAEMSVSGVTGSSHQGKRVWAELSVLMEAELSLLREENKRLQREISDARLELSSAREKARQLEALVLSVKQQKQQNQASLAKTAEQERSALKREIEALQTQLHNKLCDSSEEKKEIDHLHEENERLRNKQTILEAQLMEAQLIAMLPPSPLRVSADRRGQRHGDEMNPDINKEQEVALLKMEERMKDVELTLRNVKLLLKEKVFQLKEQLNKNSKADVLIKDLYVENSQLLKSLEVSEQRQKVAEKKNYLLEEKISSLNKIVRELSPSPLMPVPYHMTRS